MGGEKWAGESIQTVTVWCVRRSNASGRTASWTTLTGSPREKEEPRARRLGVLMRRVSTTVVQGGSTVIPTEFHCPLVLRPAGSVAFSAPPFQESTCAPASRSESDRNMRAGTCMLLSPPVTTGVLAGRTQVRRCVPNRSAPRRSGGRTGCVATGDQLAANCSAGHFTPAGRQVELT